MSEPLETAGELADLEHLLELGDSTIRQYVELLNKLHLREPFMATEQAAGVVIAGIQDMGPEQLRFLFALAVVRLSDREMHPFAGDGGL